VYQGEPSSTRDGRARGQPSAHLPPTAFVDFLQNHDQIGNRAFGERLTVLANPHALRVAQALLLLGPHIPLLFMGEEYGATQPFLYFTSHADHSLAAAVRDGRRKEFARFPEFADATARERIPDPNDAGAFIASIPQVIADPVETDGFSWLEWTAALLKLRHSHIVPRLPGCRALEAAVIGPAAISARWRMGDGVTLGMVINLGETDAELALDDAIMPAGADVLFDSGGVLQALERGVLPACAMLAVLEPAS
jgi:maltooligosyltrehalose trehalohydrolase